MMNPADNPNRPCEVCGCTSIKGAQKTSQGVKYNNLCNKCLQARVRKRVITECRCCKEEKEPDWYYYCKKCTLEKQKVYKKNSRARLTLDEKLEIKSFCEEAEKKNYWVDLLGINKLMTLYSYVAVSDADDYLSGGEQLDYMWNFLYDYYKAYIKGSTTLQLRFARLYKVTRKSMKPPMNYINFNKVDELKTCTKCGEDKLGSEFYWSPSRNILTAHCKVCAKKFYQRKRKHQKNQEKQST